MTAAAADRDIYNYTTHPALGSSKAHSSQNPNDIVHYSDLQLRDDLAVQVRCFASAVTVKKLGKPNPRKEL